MTLRWERRDKNLRTAKVSLISPGRTTMTAVGCAMDADAHEEKCRAVE
jgi:hypothetical protein